MNKEKFYFLPATVVLTVLLSLLAGCSTPQERSGVSPIPFNAQEQGESRPFGGSF